MPVIPVGAQIFDVVFHPTLSIVYTGLLDGCVKAFAYDDQGNHKPLFSLQPSKKSCRGLSLDQDGSHLFAVGKGKALSSIDTSTEAVDTIRRAHDSPINRVKYLMPWLLATGDDDGVIKLWDPRQQESVRSYTRHFDYITDFLWLDDKRQVVATSGDGTLSVMDVRSKKSIPVAQSEDQEDELLSIVSIKSATKTVVGTQLGMLSVFNRSNGWGDCVDRIPGHPLSVDALCTLPSDLPNVDSQSTILTGSSDGLVRAVQILPTKLLGVLADHGEWAIERIAIGGGQVQLTFDASEDDKKRMSGNICSKGKKEVPNSSRRWWVGSAGHDEVLRMTDLEGFFRDIKVGDKGRGGMGVVDDQESDIDEAGTDGPQGGGDSQQAATGPTIRPEDHLEEDSGLKKRKRKQENTPSTSTKKKGKKNIVSVERSFFDGL